MAEHGDINRAIAYGDGTEYAFVENGPSLSSEGHQGKALSVVSHMNIQTTHIHKHIPW